MRWSVGADACRGGLAIAVATLIACGRSPSTPSGGGSNGPTPIKSDSWVKLLGDTNPQDVSAAAVDTNGNVFAAGHACGRRVGAQYQDGSIDFGDGARPTLGECELFVAKYASSGALEWAYTDGEEGLRTEAHAIAILPSNHLVVAGKRGREMLLDELGAGRAG